MVKKKLLEREKIGEDILKNFKKQIFVKENNKKKCLGDYKSYESSG